LLQLPVDASVGAVEVKASNKKKASETTGLYSNVIHFDKILALCHPWILFRLAVSYKMFLLLYICSSLVGGIVGSIAERDLIHSILLRL
jgi:hypothetical protein